MDSSQLDFGLQLDTTRLQDFLTRLCRSQEELREQHNQLGNTLEQILKRLDKGEQGHDQHQQALHSLNERVAGLENRLDALQRLRLEEKFEQIDMYHTEFKAVQTQLAQYESNVWRNNLR